MARSSYIEKRSKQVAALRAAIHRLLLLQLLPRNRGLSPRRQPAP